MLNTTLTNQLPVGPSWYKTNCMKYLYFLLLCTVLLGCAGNKTIYDEKNITDKKLDKLMRDYSAAPSDSALANQVKFAYQYLLQQQLAEVNRYQYSSLLGDKEKLYKAYMGLQAFYDKVRGYAPADALLRPGSVGTEIAQTKLELVSAHYEQAVVWLEQKNWQTARSAYRSLAKVQQWMPDYKNTRQLQREAREAGTVHAVVLPLHAEGFYYPNNNNFGNNNLGSNNRLSDQLVRDLGGGGQSQTTSGWYRVYNTYEANRLRQKPNWTIDPFWTELRQSEPQTKRTERKAEKQVEIGKDTTGRPIYKVLVATLTITEMTYELNGRLQIRIEDNDNQQTVATNNWNEQYRYVRRFATYKGDAGALSNDDWELINAPRDNTPNNERITEEKLLEKMYPNVLNWLRGQLNQ
jgi:hypothetical protein